MSAAKITTYQQFWPFYLGEHRKASTRWMHFVGTNFATLFAVAGVVNLDWRFLPGALVCAYGMAWTSHFFIEKNRPATFTYPLWSFVSDFRMCALMWSGKLGGELQRAGVAS